MAMAAAERRRLTADDINAVRDVSDPQLSPDGQWVAYVVRTADPVKDEGDSHIWMSSWDGKQSVQLTNSDDSEGSPRWSPDGRYLAFLSDRGEDDAPRAGVAAGSTRRRGQAADRLQWRR